MSAAYGRNADGETDAGGWARHSDTVRYRYGYQVGDAEPRLVGEVKEQKDADRAAAEEATSVFNQLKSIGAPSYVSVWVQRGRSVTRTDWDEPTVRPVTI